MSGAEPVQRQGRWRDGQTPARAEQTATTGATAGAQRPAAGVDPQQYLIDAIAELKDIIKDLKEGMKVKDQDIKELKEQLMQRDRPTQRGTEAEFRTTLSPTNSDYCESAAQADYTKGMQDPRRDMGGGVAFLVDSDSDHEGSAQEAETRNAQQQQQQRRQPENSESNRAGGMPEYETRDTQRQRERQPEQPPRQQQQQRQPQGPAEHVDRAQKRKAPEMPEQRRQDRADEEDVFRTSDPWAKAPQGNWGEERERPNRYRPKGQDEKPHAAPEEEESGWETVGSRGRARARDRSERDRYQRDDSESSDLGRDQFSDERGSRRHDSRDKGRNRRPRALNYRLMKTPDTYSGSHATYKEWRQDFSGIRRLAGGQHPVDQDPQRHRDKRKEGHIGEFVQELPPESRVRRGRYMGRHDQLVQPPGKAHGRHDSEPSEAGNAQGRNGSVQADISRRDEDQQDDNVFHEVEGLRGRHGQESPRCMIHDHEVGDGEGLSTGTWEVRDELAGSASQAIDDLPARDPEDHPEGF